ncbi:hypothetical protein AQUCO_00400065v1 [Aquilegia coerulea]|uniref:Replication factor A C-terminal domain-containing protein n=1 Tax=Aquilegia coerulea TaxID=218851 RepID=A0A2G5ET60_AQUCA|nr:hypothetical protein AQUCO_00400065v1 [Aquilegia coerulea]
MDFIDYPVARYKIIVPVRDHTYSSLISIFDREVERLLKRPVTEMVDLNAMDNGAEAVKDILEKLVGLEFIFEIKISDFNRRDDSEVPSFTASKVLTVDEEIESKHFPKQIGVDDKMKTVAENIADQKMKRVVEDTTNYACSSQSNVVQDVHNMGTSPSINEVHLEEVDDVGVTSSLAKGKRSRRKL